MKKVSLLVIAVMISLFVSAQTFVFQENFESSSIGLTSSADSSGFPVSNFQSWSPSTHLYKSGAKADSNVLQPGKTIYLTSNSFSTIGNNFVVLEFSQICKLYFADGGIIEVSVDGGSTWVSIGAAEYQGSGNLITSGNISKFSDNAYTEWASGTNTIPDNSWWKNEKFDISAITANQANVKIRFKYTSTGNPFGVGRYGWLIDDIKVSVSPSELNAPSLAFASTPTDTVFTAGPYNISVYSKDASGIASVTLNYKYGNAAFNSMLMSRSTTIDSLYTAAVPFGGWGKKISYYVTSVDSSAAHNSTTIPSTTYKSFFCKFSNGGLVTIGTAALSGNFPFHANWGYSRSASLYQMNEINSFGTISELQWNVLSSGSTVFPIKVYIKELTSAALTADTWANTIAGATLVYDGTKTFPQTGWNSLLLTTPFLYTSGNLLILCESNYGGGGAGASVPTFAYTNTTQAGSHLYKNVDTNPPTTAITLGVTRPNIRLNIIGGASLSFDAGIAQIVNPIGGVTANSAFNVEARIKNYGSSVLTKAVVNYTVDGGTPVSYNWTGSLNKDSISVSFVAGILNLPLGGHSLKIWAELPNDSNDLNNINDTAYISFYACASPLSGSYTLGGATADFATFADALVGLTQCGISGAVVFNVNAGTYSNQFTIPEIFGSSAANTITFKSANNDSTSVVMNYNATGATDNWIVKLNGADNIRFKNINFAPANTTYSNAVVLTNGAVNNQLIANLFTGNAGITTDLASVRIEDIASVDNLIMGNQFNSGSMAIMCKGNSSSALLSNITIKNNTISNFGKYGVFGEYVNKMVIEGNKIASDVTAADKYGVFMHYAYATVKVIRNSISLNGATNTYGILFDNCHATDSTKGLIANNMVSITNGTSFAYGIRTLTTEYQKIYFNSVVCNGANLSDTRAINIATSSANIDILNNNLQSNRYPLHVEVNNTGKCDYNNYYATASVFVLWNNTAYANMQALRAASQKDSNSVAVNPYFISLGNLHTYNGLLNAAGKTITEVSNDIDGDLRANPPCIGADEFIAPANDATLLSILTRNTCGLTNNENVTLIIKNIGTSPVAAANLTATYGFIGSNNTLVNIVTPEVVNRNIAAGDTVHFTFAAKANLSVAATHIDSNFQIKAWVNLVGDIANANDSSQITTLSSYTPLAPIVSNFNCGYGSTVALTATSSDSLYWYDALTAGNFLYTGLNYTTLPLFSSTNYFVEAKSTNPVLVQIGNGTSTQRFPFDTYYGYSRDASLYKATEIGGHGMISQIQYQVSTTGTAALPIKIYLKEIATDVMTSQNWAGLTTGAVLVYDGTKTFDQAAWVNIQLTTPFNFATGNLIVLCETNYGGGGASLSSCPVFNYTSTAISGSHQYVQTDNNPPTDALALNSSRPNVKIKVSLSGCASPRATIAVTVAAPPPVDLGATQITSPAVSVPAAIMQPVNVKIKNYGLLALTSANVNYQINNGTVNTFAWTATTPLAFNTTEIVTVANMAFVPGRHTLKAWTSNPNNVQDTVASNDTITTTFLASLHGTYSLGDTTGGVQKDYPSFTAAAKILSIAGISDAVTFLVDTASYNEQLRIPQIYGASPTKTITFRSVNNDSTSVRLQFAATTSAANYTLKLDSADYFRFEKMSFKALGTAYGRVIELSNAANYNVFANNIIAMPVTTSSDFAGVYSGGSNNDFNTFENNSIENGYYGMYLNGISASNPQKGNIIRNNKINNFNTYGIYSYYQDSVQIVKNTIKTITPNYTAYGISANYNNNTLLIAKNMISVNSISTSTYGTLYGLYLNSCTATAVNKSLVANNTVSVEGGTATASIYGLYNNYSNFQNLYYNSVNMISAFTNSRALYVNGGSDNRVINNNFANNGGGYAYYLASSTAVSASDYNNLFTTGLVLGYYNSNRNTLSDFQTASTKDLHSQSINPLFVASHDLHLATTTISAMATPLTDVSDDIDGQIRHLIAPTIGADEFPLYQHDAGVIAILSPAAIDTEAVVSPVRVIIKNFGTDTITTMNVSYKVNNGNAVAFTYNGNLASLKVDTISLPNLSIPAGNKTICAYTVLIGDINLFNDKSCKDFFGIPLFDAQITKVSPINGGCGLTNDTVRVWIKNKGINAINGSMTASYQSNNGAIVTQNVTNVIANNDSILFSFNTPVNLSATAVDVIYNINAWANLSNDNNHVNDSASTTVTSFYTPAVPIVNNVNLPYGTSTTLTATSVGNAPIYWYDSLVGGSKINTGSNYVIPFQYVTDTVYLETNTITTIDATIGTGTSTQTYPFYTNYGYTRSASLYQSTEIGGLGNIEKLQWNIATASSLNVPVKIYLKTTTATALTSDTWSNLINGAVLVYDGTKQFNTTGWYPIALSTVFNYTGNNLMVLCEANVGGGGSSPIPYFAYSTASSNSHQYFYQDNSVPTSTGYLSTSRPNIKIYSSPKGCKSNRVNLIVNVGPQSPKDAGIVEIVSPLTGVNLSNNQIVTVKIINFGSTAISNFNINYKLDNNTVVSQIVTDIINANDTLIKSFTQTVNLSSNMQPQSFVMKAWTSLINDATALNDTTKKTVINNLPVYCISKATTIIDEDLGQVIFAGINNGNPLPVLNNPNANQMYNDYTALTPAVIQSGMTYPISLSIIFEDTPYTGKVNAYIDYNRNGVWDLPEELVFSSVYDGVNSTVTGIVNVPFTALPGLSRLRVVVDEADNAPACGTYSWGETEDYSVTILPPIPHDAGISKMNALAKFLPYTASNTQTPQFFIRNYGNDVLTAATMNYVINNAAPLTHAWTGSLLSLEMDSVIQNITLTPGMNTITAYTNGLAGDSNHNNDTLYAKVFKEFMTTPPYADNFEVNKYWFATDTLNAAPINNLWAQGIPASASPSLNAAHSPVNVWATNLNANYTVNNTSVLYTPVFDISYMLPDTLKFWQWRQFAPGTSGQIQYKNASGAWIQLGDSLSGNNWYNSANAWTGIDTSWTLSKYSVAGLTNLGPTLQFRYVFSSVANTPTMKGWAIDDFELTLASIPNDAGVTAILSPASASTVGEMITVGITVKNYGTAVLTNIPVKYQVGSDAVQSAIMAGPLAPGASANYIFTAQPYQVGILNYSICAYTLVAGDVYTQNDKICKAVSVNPAANDVGITDILQPGNSVSPGTTPIKVVLKNFGTNTQTSIPLTFQRGIQTPVNATWTGSLLAGASVEFTFPTLMSIPNGTSFSLCAFTSLANDAYIHNDTICKSVLITNGINDIDENNFSLGQNMPNPSSGITQIEYNLPSAAEVKFTISNYIGQNVYTSTHTVDAGKHMLEINVNNFSAGVYYYAIECKGKRLVKKMIVNK